MITRRDVPIGGADAPSAIPLWQTSLNALFTRLDAAATGLTTAQATQRQGTYGSNTPVRAQSGTLLRELVSFVRNPLVVILLVACLITAILGDVVNASIIIVIVALSVGLDFFQTARSQRAADALRKLVATHATALRDAQWADVPFEAIVPGDVVRLGAGDLVPADGRLLEAKDLVVNQAALTGESFPVDKGAADLPATAETRPLDAATNAVFQGTSVVSGTGTALIVHTGPATLFGQIGTHLQAQRPETEFERGMRAFALLISRTVVVLAVVVFLINVLVHHGVGVSFLFAVALAVGLTPEFLPMIVSIALAEGAVRMARKQVIVKHLPSIENFGSMDVLCTDKTGTITAGEIRLADHIDCTDHADPYVLALACLNSSHQTGIKSPLDVAILQHEPSLTPKAEKIDEIPFDFVRRRLSVVVTYQGQTLLITKGAPESVLPLCVSFRDAGTPTPLDAARRAAIEELFTRYSQQGSRLLAVAYREVSTQAKFGVADERGLTLAGFVTFLDPPGEGVDAAIAALKNDGVAVKVITGDNEHVARHVCEQVGIDATTVVLGSQMDGLTDEALGPLVEQASVFARVSPEQKQRIIRALQSQGHVVGYMGDGINDAPSLRGADIGISVTNAVDVAKEAADIILLERSLRVLHDGVMEGRKSFANIMKYILVGTSSNFGNSLSMVGGSLLLPFLPALPSQLLLNNLLYDLSEITIPNDRVDADALVKPRRWQAGVIRRFMFIFGPLTSLYDFLTFFVMLRVFHASEARFQAGWFIESLAVQTLVIFVVRTVGNPLKSRPSPLLLLSVGTCLAVAVGIILSPLGKILDLEPPPMPFLLLLVGMIVTYLCIVQLVKRWFFRHNTL